MVSTHPLGWTLIYQLSLYALASHPVLIREIRVRVKALRARLRTKAPVLKLLVLVVVIHYEFDLDSKSDIVQ